MGGAIVTNGQIEFIRVYRIKLLESIKRDPSHYFWDVSEIDTVMERIKAAILRLSFNKDTRAFKATFRALKIKNTWRDIETYLGTN